MTEPSVPAEHAATRRAMLGCAGAACAGHPGRVHHL